MYTTNVADSTIKRGVVTAFSRHLSHGCHRSTSKPKTRTLLGPSKRDRSAVGDGRPPPPPAPSTRSHVTTEFFPPRFPTHLFALHSPSSRSRELPRSKELRHSSDTISLKPKKEKEGKEVRSVLFSLRMMPAVILAVQRGRRQF